MIISLRSLIIGAVIFFFVLIAGIVLLIQDPLDVSSSYLPERDSVPAASGGENHAFSSEKPSLAMDVKLEGTSAEVTLLTQNFKFVTTDESGKQVHGQGHAHLYLDGKLIYKVYDPKFIVKKLPKGEHELRVELVYNNHLPYNKVEAVKMLQVK
jgi:hypothetical protein